MKTEKWVVLGGGYGGLAFASRWAHHHKRLSKRLSRVPSVYLLNSTAHSDCTCELYRALRTGRPEVFDIPKLLRGKAVDFKEARVIEVDPRAKVLGIRTDIRETFAYDRLILATGASRLSQDLSGLEVLTGQQNPLEPRIFNTRSNKQISELRMALTRIQWADPKNKREQFVVIVGGGATGVEIAGEIAALRNAASTKRVVVVEASYDPLKPVLGAIGNKILREEMKRARIEYFEGSRAARIDNRHLYLANGQMVPWELLVVAQGSMPDLKLFEQFGDVWSDEQRVRVARDFHIEDWSHHYAIGDLAHYELGGEVLPKTAQVAAQQGSYLADSMACELLGEAPPAPVFKWQNWGYLISLGPNRGAGKLGSWPLPVLWGPAVDLAKRAAKLRFDAQVTTGLKLAP